MLVLGGCGNDAQAHSDVLAGGDIQRICTSFGWFTNYNLSLHHRTPQGASVLEQASEQFPTSGSDLAVFYHSGMHHLSDGGHPQ